MGTIPYGATVTLLTQTSEWYKITYNGITGYVSREYVTRNSSSDASGTGSGATNTGANTGTSSAITGTVTASSLNIRASKSTSADILGTIPYGATVTLLTQTSEWYKITYNGITGYVSRQYVTRNSSSGSSGTGSGATNTGTSSAITGTVTASSLNIRASKSTSADILGTVPYGATVTLLTQTSEWYKITYNGITATSAGSTSPATARPVFGSEGSSGTGSAGEAEDPSSLEAICAGTVTASSLALRQEPDEDSTRLATASSAPKSRCWAFRAMAAGALQRAYRLHEQGVCGQPAV